MINSFHYDDHMLLTFEDSVMTIMNDNGEKKEKEFVPADPDWDFLRQIKPKFIKPALNKRDFYIGWEFNKNAIKEIKKKPFIVKEV